MGDQLKNKILISYCVVESRSLIIIDIDPSDFLKLFHAFLHSGTHVPVAVCSET